MNNLAHEWYIRAYDCQIMLDAIGDSTIGANCTARTSQPLHRTFTIPSARWNDASFVINAERAANWLWPKWNQWTCPKLQVRYTCWYTKCAFLCARARACVCVGTGLLLVCLRVSYCAPPRPPALDPPLHTHGPSVEECCRPELDWLAISAPTESTDHDIIINIEEVMVIIGNDGRTTQFNVQCDSSPFISLHHLP